MEPRHRALIAVQPAAWPLVQGMLGDLFHLVPAHSISEALGELERHDVDLIVCSLTFSDSRMLEFLVTVKADPATAAIPFVCCRMIVGILSENLVEKLGQAARLCGAADFVNVGARPPGAGHEALRAAALAAVGGASLPRAADS